MPKFRNDDICYGTDVEKLKEIQFLIGKEYLAVIPFGTMNPKDKHKFNEDDKLMRYLQDRVKAGDEICLHGWKHLDITKYKIKDTIWRIIEAKSYLERALDIKIKYFVPPFHLINSEIEHWLKVIGLEVLDGRDSEDLDALAETNQQPAKEIFYYHWWKTDIDKLKIWLENYQKNCQS